MLRCRSVSLERRGVWRQHSPPTERPKTEEHVCVCEEGRNTKFIHIGSQNIIDNRRGHKCDLIIHILNINIDYLFGARHALVIV